MVEFITNITSAGNSVWTACLGLFTIVALIALGICLALTAMSSDQRKNEHLKKIFVILGCCAGFGAASMLVTWALGIG